MSGMDDDTLQLGLFESKIYTVSSLVSELKDHLENDFFEVEVEGEISGFKSYPSGHYYFSLKDEKVELQAVMFRTKNIYLSFKPENGMQVKVQGRVTIYEPRGQLQLRVEHMEQAGVGAALLALRKMIEKLSKEGLFDKEHKKPLPPIPKKIGIVTSPKGAAIRDFLKVIQRRFAEIDILIYPSRVQGEKATGELTEGIKYLDDRDDIELIVITRGGGSPEDLAPFNDETLARTIFEAKTPIISAVGHEIDTSISDLVADYRAPTPSAAAEIIVEQKTTITDKIKRLSERITERVHHEIRLKKEQLRGIGRATMFANPYTLIDRKSQDIDRLTEKLNHAANQEFRKHHEKFEKMSSVLKSLDPLAVLGRGYSLTMKADASVLITNSNQVKEGEKIITRLKSGMFESKVSEIDTKEKT